METSLDDVFIADFGSYEFSSIGSNLLEVSVPEQLHLRTGKRLKRI